MWNQLESMLRLEKAERQLSYFIFLQSKKIDCLYHQLSLQHNPYV